METESRASALAIRHPLRVAILDALASGVRVRPEDFAKSRDLGPAAVGYHFDVLVEVGAIEPLEDGFRMTERGEVLHGLAHSPDRRTRERRRNQRRQS